MVETFDVSITPYGLTRRTFVYLPDDWQTSGKKYPVLYMFDGHNLFFDSTATYGTCWGLKEYCDAHPNWIIAAPECNHEGNKRLEEYCPYQSDWFGGITGTGHEYMEWLTKEFKPMMDKRYPTLPGRANTAIGGSSMGGLMSLYALLQYNDTYSRAAALSPSIWAIGHNDVEYNSVDQLITYIPNPKDRTKKKTEYLLEFENEAMRMFQAILGVSKYLYRLRKLELMHDGKIPIMVQERAN